MKLIGNKHIFKQLEIAIESAITENNPLPHTLLSGAAGCGKTSTARFIAEMGGCGFLEISPENIQIRDDMLKIREQLDDEGYNDAGDKTAPIRPTIVFIDEIHRLKTTGQEHLGLAMEDWMIPVEEKQVEIDPYGKFGYNRKGKVRWCPQFTLIGATTNDGSLSKPFKDRFKLRFLFNTYNLEESIEIIKLHAKRLNDENAKRWDNQTSKRIMLSYNAVTEIAKRGRGVPRILVGLLERCRDMAISHGKELVDELIAKSTFMLMGIDEAGLTPVDIRIMKALYENKDPIGVDNMSIIVNEPKKTITDTIEPYLIQRELISRASKGRTLTEKGRAYLIKNRHIEGNVKHYVDIPLSYERRI